MQFTKHGVTFKVVNKGFWLFVLNMLKANGWCSCWSTIYIREGYLTQVRCRHEYQHYLQMQREGTVKMMIKYTWFLIRFGYTDNPYEIEARAKQYCKDYLFLV